MHNAGGELRRIPLLSTSVNKGKEKTTLPLVPILAIVVYEAAGYLR
jgi:hypothetical protein